MKLLLKQAMPLIFGFGLVLATVLLLMPSFAVPKAFDFYDKAQHGLMFSVLTVAGLLAYPQRVIAVCCGLCFYGGLMEVLQSVLTTTRHGDVIDWFADSLGVAVGLVVYVLGAQFIKQIMKQTIKKIATNKIAN